jgi:NADH dehydrogenase/NADH:ubiquinone oxidoreductase subunit G
MSGKVTLTIDGKKVEAAAGSTVLDAALGAGIDIPNLCYLKGMKGIGACRLCLVEIEGMKAPMTACTARVKEGMVVSTTNEQIEEIRRYVIDLILSMHPLDCMTCTKAGVCDLQRYAYEFEIKESSFTRKKFGFPVDEGNPFIKRDPDYCIHCARCVRVCKEQGTSVLDFQGRGVGSKVTTAQDRPLQEAGCTFCGSCIDACPVNAILEADRWRRGREWQYERVESTCLFCGNACSTVVSTYKGQVAKINAGGDRGRTEHYICAYGRYGFDYINADTRVLEPLRKTDGQLSPVSWTEAIDSVSRLLMDEEHTGIIVSGNLTNEDYLTLRGFVTEAGIKNTDSTASLYGDEKTLLSDKVDLNEADLMVVVGLNPSQWERVHPALDAIIRKATSRGAKLITINPQETRIDKAATINIKTEETEALIAFSKSLKDKGLTLPKGLKIPQVSVSEEIEQATELYTKARNPVIITSPPLFEAAANITLMKGSIISVPIEANASGAILMAVKGQGKGIKQLQTEGIKILYVIGDVEMKRPQGVDTLIVQSSHMTSLAREADIVLPLVTSYETEGTIVDFTGRLKTIRQAIQPIGEAKNLRDTLRDIAKKMGIKIKTARATDVKKEIKAYKTERKPSEFKKREDLQFRPEEFIPSVNEAMINGSRLLWLKEIEKAVAA